MRISTLVPVVIGSILVGSLLFLDYSSSGVEEPTIVPENPEIRSVQGYGSGTQSDQQERVTSSDEPNQNGEEKSPFQAEIQEAGKGTLDINPTNATSEAEMFLSESKDTDSESGNDLTEDQAPEQSSNSGTQSDQDEGSYKNAAYEAEKLFSESKDTGSKSGNDLKENQAPESVVSAEANLPEYFEMLPRELKYEILRKLPWKEIYRLGSVNKEFLGIRDSLNERKLARMIEEAFPEYQAEEDEDKRQVLEDEISFYFDAALHLLPEGEQVACSMYIKGLKMILFRGMKVYFLFKDAFKPYGILNDLKQTVARLHCRVGLLELLQKEEPRVCCYRNWSTNKISLSLPHPEVEIKLAIESKERYDSLIKEGSGPSKIIESLIARPDLSYLEGVDELLPFNHADTSNIEIFIGLLATDENWKLAFKHIKKGEPCMTIVEYLVTKPKVSEKLVLQLISEMPRSNTIQFVFAIAVFKGNVKFYDALRRLEGGSMDPSSLLEAGLMHDFEEEALLDIIISWEGFKFSIHLVYLAICKKKSTKFIKSLLNRCTDRYTIFSPKAIWEQKFISNLTESDLPALQELHLWERRSSHYHLLELFKSCKSDLWLARLVSFCLETGSLPELSLELSFWEFPRTALVLLKGFLKDRENAAIDHILFNDYDELMDIYLEWAIPQLKESLKSIFDVEEPTLEQVKKWLKTVFRKSNLDPIRTNYLVLL